MVQLKSPLVSIVIPVYNHHLFLERCLQSVLAQTYSNLEIVIVDDCSQDHSIDLANQLMHQPEWQMRFNGRIKIHRFSENQGAHAAINYGIQASDGSVLAILNSDDCYCPHRIQRAIEAIRTKRSEFVFTKVQYIDEYDNDISQSHMTALHFNRMQRNIDNFPSVGFACLPSNVAISTGNFVFTKALFKKVGKFAPYRYCHDWDFLLRSIVYTEPVFINQSLYKYRFHGKNTFESLQTVAVEETRSIISNYLSIVKEQWTPNPIAPSSLNWTSFFEVFLYWYGFDGVFNAKI